MVLKLCLLVYLTSAVFIVNVVCENTSATSNQVASADITPNSNSSIDKVTEAGAPKAETLPASTEATTISATTEVDTTAAPTEPPETTTEEQSSSSEPASDNEYTTEELTNDSETTADGDQTISDEEQTDEADARVPNETTEVESEATDDFTGDGGFGDSQQSSTGKHKTTTKPRRHKSAAGTVVCHRALITSFVVISLYVSALI